MVADRSAAPLLRRALKGAFGALTLLMVLAAALGLVAWRKASTPLEPADPRPRAASGSFDPEAYDAGELQFPGVSWDPVPAGELGRLGWSEEKLAEAHAWARSLDTSSVMVVHRGVPVAVWGDVARRENSQSVRKSLLSSLFGFLVTDGRLSLDATLAELGVTDDPPLTEAERRATVRDLLLSRSGVYHSALYEVGSWKRRIPERGSHRPGEHWYYNHWGFNALATIFERSAGRPPDGAFADWVAEPIGMEDVRPEDVVYLTRDHPAEKAMGNESDHPAYVFMISARDLARFGLLYLADGVWDGRRVLPAGWVEESTLGSARETGIENLRYGYMWWVYPPTESRPGPIVVARGGRGHRLMIFPDLDLVVVHRIPTGGVGLASQLFRRFVWHAAVSDGQLDELVRRILAAHPDAGPEAGSEAGPVSRSAGADRSPPAARPASGTPPASGRFAS